MTRLCDDGGVSSPTESSQLPQADQSLNFHPPVRAWVLAEWALVPLRLFLGVTFTYAGLQKLANPNFFNSKSPISIHSQLVASAHTSPIHALLVHLEPAATLIGLLIAFGELAIGLGTLLGFWTRAAAVSGLILSLSLFLTVSYHSSPYFVGADIVFFFAWMPLILAGSSSRLSLDGWIAHRVTKEEGLPSPAMVAIPFATVQRLCGNYVGGNCSARGGLPCDASACPVLLGSSAPSATPVVIDALNRRTVMLGSASAVAVGASVLLLGGVDAAAGRIAGHASAPKGTIEFGLGSTSTTTTTPSSSSAPTTTTSTTPAPKGKLLGAASQVKRNEAATFVIPSNGDPGILIHTDAGEFVAYDAVCPHMGCTVGYSRAAKVIVCPCHGSEFQVNNGHVIVGPAPHGLKKLKVLDASNGNLYLE
jgi:thiosulfate dehydrogenase [quinone] large subunit